jgi:hypothetical protein
MVKQLTVEDWGTLADLVWAERNKPDNQRADSVVVLDELHDKCVERYHALKQNSNGENARVIQRVGESLAGILRVELTNDEIIDVREALLAKGDLPSLSVHDQNLFRDCDIALGVVRCGTEARKEARNRIAHSIKEKTP